MWRAPHGPPKLQWASSSSGLRTMEDTRDGTPRSYVLNVKETQLLDSLAEPVREETIVREYRDELESLRHKGLVFGERGRIASIVSTVN
jgi:hypothetical protein